MPRDTTMDRDTTILKATTMDRATTILRDTTIPRDTTMDRGVMCRPQRPVPGLATVISGWPTARTVPTPTLMNGATNPGIMAAEFPRVVNSIAAHPPLPLLARPEVPLATQVRIQTFTSAAPVREVAVLVPITATSVHGVRVAFTVANGAVIHRPR